MLNVAHSIQNTIPPSAKPTTLPPPFHSMADTPSKDDAAKARIIKHLNADHQESLTLYLRHYAGLSPSTARSPTITDISFSEMTFHTRDGKTHTVPFNPPMSSWSEARTRTVEMDKESRAALDVSSIRITEYELPQGIIQWGILALLGFALGVYFKLDSIVPGTFVYDTLLPWFPGGRKWFFGFTGRLPQGVFAIHLVEALCLDHFKLRKYNVSRGSQLWWKWFGSSIVEGGGAIARINAMVKRKTEEAEKRQH